MANPIPRICIAMGDPAGISPEVLAKLLARSDLLKLACVSVIGDRRVLAEGETVAGVKSDIAVVALAEIEQAKPGEPVFVDLRHLDPATLRRGEASAGEGGVFGREEIDIIGPAVEDGRRRGHAVEGPFPADTIWIKARRGDYDAVLSMYHDQGQIALKLLGFERGVTILGGLPVPIATPAHGTAYDIAGRGIADPSAIIKAFETLVALAAMALPARPREA